MNFKIHRISKDGKVINCDENYSVNIRLNLKTRFVWDKEKHTISQMFSVGLTPICWSMSVKSSIIRCLSNAVVKIPRNCRERTLNIAVIKYFWNDTLHKKMTITATEIVPIQLFSYTVVSKQKHKNENKEYYGTFI